MGKPAPFFMAFLVLAALAAPAPAAPGAVAFSRIVATLSSGDAAQAFRLADTALGEPGLTDADRGRLLLYRGLANHLKGDSDAALADLTQAIEARGLPVREQARAYLERGLVLDVMGRLNDAIGDYGAVLRLVPGSATALNNRANAFRRQNRFEDAKRDYLASLAADNPAPEYPYYGLGQIAESQGRGAEAKSFYARALAANPGYALAAQRLTALGGTAEPLPPIILRPPRAQAAQAGAIRLHPPTAKMRPRTPTAMAPAPLVRPTGYSDRPGLRPALDNSGGQAVQLGAWRSETEARAGWNRAVAAAGGALSGFSPHIVVVDLPGRGRYYRLRVAAADGKRLCAALTARQIDCIPARD